MKNKSLIITIVAALVFAAIGFFGGMKYQQGRRGNFAQFAARNGTTTGQNGNRNTAVRPVSGSIISTDSNSITVKLTDGSSKIVILTDTTQIDQATTAAKTDLKIGETVATFGTQNSDGSITAQSISINPQVLRGPNQ